MGETVFLHRRLSISNSSDHGSLSSKPFRRGFSFRGNAVWRSTEILVWHTGRERKKSGNMYVSKVFQSLCSNGLKLMFVGVWREQADAKRGSQGEGHRQSVRFTSKLYTEWRVERLKLVIGENGKSLEITDWED